MFISLFLSQVAAKSTADLTPPFDLAQMMAIGNWEFSGAAIVEEESIMLCPPVQYTHGAAWTNVQMPKDNWRIKFRFRIHEGSGGGGIGIWFIDKYGADGPLHGGPSQFKGVGVLATIITYLDGSKGLGFNVVQNNGDKIFTFDTFDDYDYTFKYSAEKDVVLYVTFINQKFVVSIHNNNTNTEVIATRNLMVSIEDAFIGVTAQSDAFTSRVDILSAIFKFMTESKDKAGVSIEQEGGDMDANSRKVNPIHDNSAGHYQPEGRTHYRNPLFQHTVDELKERYEKHNEIDKDATIEKLFGVINEINQVTNQVAGFKDLCEFVRNNLVNYSQKWHKRTIKMVEDIQRARNVLGGAWNYTEEIMGDMNRTVRMNAIRMAFKVTTLEELLASDSEAGIGDELNIAEKEVQKSLLIRILTIFSAIEFTIIVIFFIYALLRKNNHEW